MELYFYLKEQPQHYIMNIICFVLNFIKINQKKNNMLPQNKVIRPVVGSIDFIISISI